MYYLIKTISVYVCSIKKQVYCILICILDLKQLHVNRDNVSRNATYVDSLSFCGGKVQHYDKEELFLSIYGLLITYVVLS